jgi:hypothetical protein
LWPAAAGTGTVGRCFVNGLGQVQRIVLVITSSLINSSSGIGLGVAIAKTPPGPRPPSPLLGCPCAPHVTPLACSVSISLLRGVARRRAQAQERQAVLVLPFGVSPRQTGRRQRQARPQGRQLRSVWVGPSCFVAGAGSSRSKQCHHLLTHPYAIHRSICRRGLRWISIGHGEATISFLLTATPRI